MSSFTFDIGGKKVNASVTKVKGAINHRFEATGKCPFCKQAFTVGNNPGQFRTEAEVKASLKFTMKRHYNSKH